MFVDWHAPYDDGGEPAPLLDPGTAELVAEMLHQTHPFSTPKPVGPLDGDQPDPPVALIDYGAPIPPPDLGPGPASPPTVA